MTAISSSMDRLAGALEKDIKRRGLTAGDRYMTAAQAAGVLGVGARTADRALNALASRQVLVRHRSSGTFIGPAIVGTEQVRMRLIQVVMPRYKHPNFNEMIACLHESFPDAGVQFDFMPEQGEVEFVRHLIDKAKGENGTCGMILFNVSPEVYSFACNQPLPIVVCSSGYPEDGPAASVDADYHQTGELLINYVLERGHRRIALLSWDYNRPGDNAIMDRIFEKLTGAKLPPNALVIRQIREDAGVIRSEARRLLESPECPTAFVCRSWVHAHAVADAAVLLGLSVPDDVLIICEDRSPQESLSEIFPCVTRVGEFHMLGIIVKDLFDRQIGGEPIEHKHVTVPVKVREPSERAGKMNATIFDDAKKSPAS